MRKAEEGATTPPIERGTDQRAAVEIESLRMPRRTTPTWEIEMLISSALVFSLFQVVGISLMLSWLVAVLFTPYLGFRLLREEAHAPHDEDMVYRHAFRAEAFSGFGRDRG